MTVAGKHVLVLEDEPIIAFALEDMLLDEGASVVVVSSLDQAMDSLKGRDIDFAVLDVNLHGEKSYPFAYQLLERDIAFAFATGYGDAEHPSDLAHVPTITKPYTLSQVQDASERAAPDS